MSIKWDDKLLAGRGECPGFRRLNQGTLMNGTTFATAEQTLASRSVLTEREIISILAILQAEIWISALEVFL